MKLAIVLTKEHRLLSVAALLDVFETVNTFSEEDGKDAPFTISLVSQDEDAGSYPGYKTIVAKKEDYFDLILLPAFRNGSTALAIGDNLNCIPWIREQYLDGAAIASFCTGAFLLASTGLLNGRPATTHINAGGFFAKAFPEVLLQEEAVITEKDRLYTSGGATNSFHLMMRLIEIYCGRPMAVRIAKIFSIDMDRSRQDYFGSFMPVEDHGDDLVRQAQDEIRRNFSKANTIEEIITAVPSSRRNLVRRFKHVTGITPIEYLQKTRIEAAKQLLENSRQSITDVMLESGYNDLKTFRMLFKKNVGMTPKMYRSKFAGQLV